MKYCKYCGRQLQDLELCTCRDTMINNTTTETLPKNPEMTLQVKQKKQPSVFMTALKNVIPYIKAFIKSPNNTLQATARNTDLPLAAIFYVLYIMSFVLANVVFWSKVSKLIDIVSNLIGSVLLSFNIESIQISNMTVILYSLILGLFYIVITNLLIIILKGILQSKYNTKQLIAASSGIFIIPTVLLLLSVLFSLVSVSISLCFLFASGISHLLIFFYSSKCLCETSDQARGLWILIAGATCLFLVNGFLTVKVPLTFADQLIQVNQSSYPDYGYYEDDQMNENYFFDDFFGY